MAWVAWSLAPSLLLLLLVGPRGGWGPVRAFGRRQRVLLLSFGVGLASALPVCVFERWFAALTGFGPRDHIAGSLPSVIASLLLFAPLEQGAELANVIWIARTHRLTASEGILASASALALGFATTQNAFYFHQGRGVLVPIGFGAASLGVRALLSTVAGQFCAGVWGAALGRTRAHLRRLAQLAGVFAAATLVRGLSDHLVFGRGLTSLAGALPLYVGMAVMAAASVQELEGRSHGFADRISRLPLLHALPPPPTLTQMRSALRRNERPVIVHWIVLGGLVTMGAIVCAVVLAILLGRRLGVDFGAIDEGQLTAVVPLLLIGTAIAVAFPSAAFLVARASGTKSVLEPALSAGLAIVSGIVLIGFAAPVGVVFAVAFAPVGFGLACAGAWVGKT